MTLRGLQRVVRQWVKVLQLTHWTITLQVADRHPLPDCPEDAVATCIPQWQYLNAEILVSPVFLTIDPEQASPIILHELLHAVVSEMREAELDHEERVVSHLTNIILSAYAEPPPKTRTPSKR